jgi:hypothetical protein
VEVKERLGEDKFVQIFEAALNAVRLAWHPRPPSEATRRERLTEIAQLAERLAGAVYRYEGDAVDYNDDLTPEGVTNEGIWLPSVLLQLADRARQLAGSRPGTDPAAPRPYSRRLKFWYTSRTP